MTRFASVFAGILLLRFSPVSGDKNVFAAIPPRELDALLSKDSPEAIDIAATAPGEFVGTPSIQNYIIACRENQIVPSADALITLHLHSPHMVIRTTDARPFGDLELWALARLLEDNNGEHLSSLRSLDLSSTSLGPSGVLLVASLLRHPKCRLRSVDISNQLFNQEVVLTRRFISAVSELKSLEKLHMHGCDLGSPGGEVLSKYLRTRTTSSHLRFINLENNYIEFHTCLSLSQVAASQNVTLSLAGNNVEDEVFNATSHGFGAVLSIIGFVLLLKRVKHKPGHYTFAVVLYCTALNIMYLSSTLYHSFFALGRETVHIFKILDYSGIFLLIAGSYSPFLGILFHDELWASILLAFMWLIALTGIYTAAFYRGPNQQLLRLSLYIGMGWTVVVCIRPMALKLGRNGLCLLFVGGCLYTGGVPFFVRGNHTFGLPDHTIWHLFVVSASICHYLCIYWYVAGDPPKAGSIEKGAVDNNALLATETRADAVPIYTEVPLSLM
eukprot:TRINITY_DN25106_c0_g1_i9.p1 TRINITY_DN25106_c0_g1~~TRINITY_DN25106_c0_g1_i9.p1  ORF type:complete len:500 (-),score=37.79 TRINITY_DN25106_c0_g1_i9:389-1888(-)